MTFFDATSIRGGLRGLSQPARLKPCRRAEDALGIPARDEIARRQALTGASKAGELGEGAADGSRILSALHQLEERGCAVALGEALAVGPHHERHVAEARNGKAERLVEEDLPRRRGEEVVAAQHLRDL